jgi:hypothetical protein
MDALRTITQSETGLQIDLDRLTEFENNLNPMAPEANAIPCKILGYGEISTVFEIKLEEFRGLALKRMSIFENREEFATYLISYKEYNRLLEEDLKINLPEHGYALIENLDGRPIFYIVQQKVEAAGIGSNAIHRLSSAESLVLFNWTLGECNKVWEYNRRAGPIRVAIDGQISNWALSKFDPEHPELAPDADLLYLDTSTPIFQVDGVDQLEPELFLRSGPSFMAWIIRQFFLEDVMTRYFNPRQVIIDLIANLIKEGTEALIPDMITAANIFLVDELAYLSLEPLTEQEIRAYYREDAFIWSLYAAMRRVDRILHKILGKKYQYILPGKVKR